MSARTYPREWFKANRYTTEPVAKIFERETEHRLYWTQGGRTRFEPKISQWATWYPTREEAEAAIKALHIAFDESAARLAARHRLNAAAPELLEALKTKRDYVADAAAGALTYEDSGEGFMAMAKQDLARIDAAIAKATGEA